MADDVLWTPRADALSTSRLGRYLQWLAENKGRRYTTYPELWDWSVADLEGFWQSVWEFFEVRAHAPHGRVLAAPDARRDVVPGGASELRRARGRHATRNDAVALDRALADPRSRARPPAASCATRWPVPAPGCSASASARATGSSATCPISARRRRLPRHASLGAIWAAARPSSGTASWTGSGSEPKVLLTVPGYVYGDG